MENEGGGRWRSRCRYRVQAGKGYVQVFPWATRRQIRRNIMKRKVKEMKNRFDEGEESENNWEKDRLEDKLLRSER